MKKIHGIVGLSGLVYCIAVLAASLVLVSLGTTASFGVPPLHPGTESIQNNRPVPVAPISRGTTARAADPVLGAAIAVQKVDYLLFCNQPERLNRPGAYADARLVGGKTYRIFFHYRNASGMSAPLTLAFHGTDGKPLSLEIRTGIAEPQSDPPRAGQQAMLRYLKARSIIRTGRQGAVSLSMTLRAYNTASGIVTVRPAQDCRFRIFFAGGRQPVRGARTTAVPAPYREILVALTDRDATQYFRIGEANDLPGSRSGKARVLRARAQMDGSYGMVYAFSVKAPVGRRVRVTFSPRGGQSGMIALLNGVVRSSEIIGPSSLAVFAETRTTQTGFALVTMPFGGVFYPVEIAFHLL